MTIEEILVFDNINNNNAQYTVEELIDSFNSYVKNGKVYRVNNTIIFVKQVLDGVMYFHTANSDKFNVFVDNINKFFKNVDVDCVHTAVTYFDNRKLKMFFYKPYTQVSEVTSEHTIFKYKGVIDIRMFHGIC